MLDKSTRNLLEKERLNMTLDELVRSKMKRKGMSRSEAIADIYLTATKTNKNVDKELGVK